MTPCPEIDLLLDASSRGASAEHLSSCRACAAVAALAEVREERILGQDDDCARIEVAIALGRVELLDEAGARELVAHLERCSRCNEIAARVRALGAEAVPSASARTLARFDAEAPTARARSGGYALAFAAGALVVLAGALAWRAVSPAPLAVAPNAMPESPAPHASAAPASPNIEQRPAGEVVAPRVPASTSAPPRPTGSPDLIDPWNAPARPSSKPSSPPLSPAPARGGSELMDPWSVGYLSVMCVPGCSRVLVDGKNFGPSPLVRVVLAKGAHTVTAIAGKIRRVRRIAIVSGKTRVLSVRMDAPPPDTEF